MLYNISMLDIHERQVYCNNHLSNFEGKLNFMSNFGFI